MSEEYGQLSSRDLVRCIFECTAYLEIGGSTMQP